MLSLDVGIPEFEEVIPSRRFNSAFSARRPEFSASSASTRATSEATSPASSSYEVDG